MRKFFKVSFFVVLFLGLFFAREAFAQKKAWAPYKGTSTVSQNGTWQYFTFTCAAAGKFDFRSTYEMETQVSGKDFADSDGGYYRSTLPHDYRDTRVLDCWPFANGSIDNFTVGSAEARLIFGNTQYYTYMKLKPGSVKTATVRIRGQKGYRLNDKPDYLLRFDPLTNIFPSETTYPDYLCILTAPSAACWSY
ncbi:MAG: hypothetical protein V1770_03625 [bacterium]